MALFIFKIIFLVVFIVGVLIMFIAPFIYGRQNRENPAVSRKVTRLRLIGLIIGCVGLLVVLILAGIKQ